LDEGIIEKSWLDHLERMEEDGMPKEIFTQELEGTRRRGKPRKGWKQEVETDMESWWQIGIHGRTLFDRPKPTVGFSANGRGRRIQSSNCPVRPFVHPHAFYNPILILTLGQ